MQKLQQAAKGFTLIELIIVIVLLSILVAVAIPKYQDLTTQGQNAMQKGLANAVKSAWAIYVAQNTGSFPTVNALATALNTTTAGTGPGCRAVATGIACTLGNQAIVNIPIYQDAACSTAVTTATNSVQCVGL